VSSLREEISTEEVKHSELGSESFSLNETFSHEHVLANELEIGNDDSNRSEKGLKTFGELRTTKITGVHGNVSTAGGIQTDLISLEEESLLVFLDGIEDSLELDGAHREHFGDESVKLIEATPRSRGGKTLEDTGETEIIHVIGAVEDVASLSDGIGEILGGLCLTGTSGTGGSATHLQVKGLCGCDVNSIGKRGNDESRTVTKVLVTVPELGIGDSEEEITLPGVEVHLELSLPLEVVGRCAFLNDHLINDISGVSINCNKAHDLLTERSIEVTLSHLNEFREAINLVLKCLLHGLRVCLKVAVSTLDIASPVGHVNEECHLGRI
jgi:hypothetical protein